MKKIVVILASLCLFVVVPVVISAFTSSDITNDRFVSDTIVNNEISGGDMVFISESDTVKANGDFIVGSVGEGGKLVVNGVLEVYGDFYNAFGSTVTVNGRLVVHGAFHNFESELDVKGAISVKDGFDNLYGGNVDCGGDLLVADN